MIHAYRWRLGLEHVAPQLGTPNREQLSGKYSHRFFKGIGHHVPREAPRKFAQAIMDVDRY